MEGPSCIRKGGGGVQGEIGRCELQAEQVKQVEQGAWERWQLTRGCGCGC